MKQFETRSAEETIELGRRIAAGLPARAVVLLSGNLGAGKTTLAKGILSGLGVARPEDVTSPTFTLIHEYGGGEPSGGEFGSGTSGGSRAYHIDLYRLDTPAQLATLGLDEILDRDAVVLVEWGERFPELFPGAIEIRIEACGEDARRIEMPGQVAPQGNV